MASEKYQTEASRWAAVRARDPAADGAFIYCVETTKIYCQPVCKARLARRSNVEFYTYPEEAVTRGFRPCKRCKPELERFVPETDQSIDRIRLLLENLPEDAPLPKLEVLAQVAGLTKFHFHRCFKKATGMTPREYALSRRRNQKEFSALGISQDAMSSMSTPSLAQDSSLSGSVLTPGTEELANINFDDWLADGMEEPLMDGNLPLREEHFGSGLAAMTQGNLTSFADAVKTAITYDIHYATIETTGGVLLMAFQDEQVCKLELLTTLYEAMGALEESFPTCLYVHIPAEVLPNEQRLPIQMRIAAVAESLEMPLGKDRGQPQS